MNPPYGKETPKWLSKLADHGNGIALVFARTDTKWFQEIATRADIVCFVSGRIRFFQGNKYRRGGSPGAGSVLIGFGAFASEAIRKSGLGFCTTPSIGGSLDRFVA